MKLKFLFYSIIILLFIKSIFSGQIYLEEPTLIYQNVGFFNTVKFQFSLENPLSTSDFIKIIWPFEWF